MKSSRPAPKLAETPARLLLRWGPLAATVVVALVALGTYGALPDEVPTHFTGAMTPDSYGPKWSVLVIGAVFLAVSAVLGWLTGRPQWFNYPVPVTEENAQRVYRAGQAMMSALGLAIPLLFGGLVMAVHGLPALPLMIAGFVVMAVAVVGGIWGIGHAGRVEKTYRYGRGGDR